MTAAGTSKAKAGSNKAKIAKRVIEVFEYFDGRNRHATVMDIVRRYNRPQSSTSELMASLVEMGLLYKDPVSRSYTPTPRAAILCTRAQPSMVRDGKLWELIDRLAEDIGLGVVLMGMVGVNVQIFHSVPGAGGRDLALEGGSQDRLVDSAGGWLFLSTLPATRRDGILRRLNAEAQDEDRFDAAVLRRRVEHCARHGYAVGPAGFGAPHHMCAMLLPIEAGERPLALGIVCASAEAVDSTAVIAQLRRAVEHCGNDTAAPPVLEPVSNDGEALLIA